jgi:hypothetical protein
MIIALHFPYFPVAQLKNGDKQTPFRNKKIHSINEKAQHK